MQGEGGVTGVDRGLVGTVANIVMKESQLYMEQELGVDSTGINSKYKVAFAIKNDESLILEEFYMHTTV